MFAKHHEQDLAEIKALIFELGQRVQGIQEQLEHIVEAQEQLEMQGQPESQDVLAKSGKRKKARHQASASALGTDAKSGKSRRAIRLGSSDDAPEGSARSRRRDGAGQKQRRPRPASSSGAGEE
jgi:hypothetical protein